MPAKREVPNSDDLIRAYLAGEPMRQRLKEAAVSDCLFGRLLRDAGVERRAMQDSYAIRRSRPKPGPKSTPENMAELIADYAAGASEKTLAARAGVTRGTMRGLLVRHGVPHRGRSEAALAKWSTMKHDRAAVERQCSAAWAAADRRDEEAQKIVPRVYELVPVGARVVADALGMSKGNVQRILRKAGINGLRAGERHAVGMHAAVNNPVVSRFELPMLVAMLVHGLEPVHQFPIGSCNVDFAFPELRVAVELERRPLCSSKSLTPKRVEDLFNSGWRLLIVLDGKRRGIDFDAVAQQLVACLDALRRDPSIPGQYGVISRDGKTSTRTGRNLHGWPRIRGL